MQARNRPETCWQVKPEPGPTHNSGQKTKWRLPRQVYSVMEVRKVLMRFRCSRFPWNKNFNSLVVNCYVGGPHPGNSFKVPRDQPWFVESWKITFNHRGCYTVVTVLTYWAVQRWFPSKMKLNNLYQRRKHDLMRNFYCFDCSTGQLGSVVIINAKHICQVWWQSLWICVSVNSFDYCKSPSAISCTLQESAFLLFLKISYNFLWFTIWVV